MVTGQRKYVSITEAERFIMESNTPNEALNKLHSLRKRQSNQVIPQGGISVRQAGNKYNVSPSSISRWAKRGLIKIIYRVDNWLYIDEKSLKLYLKQRG